MSTGTKTAWSNRIKVPRIKCLLLLPAFLLIVSNPATAQQTQKPSVVIFQLDGDKNLVPSVTTAVKATLKQGNSLNLTEYRTDLPTLRRAVVEKTLNSEDLQARSIDQKKKIARALEATHFLDGETWEDRDGIHLVLSSHAVRGDKNLKHEAHVKATTEGSANRATLLMTVANTTVSQFMQQMLGLMPPAVPPSIPAGLETPSPAPSDTNKTPDPAPVVQPEPAPQPAPAPDPVPAPTPSPLNQDAVRLEAESFSLKADSLSSSGDLAGAIQSMQAAINLYPENVEYRVKLSDLYKRKGMAAEAQAELQRLVMLAPQDTDSRSAIAQQLQNTGQLDAAREMYLSILEDEPENTAVRLMLGDVLWNLGKLDDAALEYAQASNIDKDSAAPHERLARLFAARGMFLEATGSLAAVHKLTRKDPNSPVDVNLYKSVSKSADVAYFRYLDQMDNSLKDFTTGRTTREEYYKSVRQNLTRVEELTDFLTDLIAPADYQKAHLHRTLASSLLSQSITSTQDWLMKNQQESKTNAEQFRLEAAAEMDAAAAAEKRLR